jgi:MFS family permease
MSSLSSLSAAIVLLPGAMLVERLGRRRPIVLTGAGWARFALLPLGLLPFFVHAPWIVFVAIGLSVSRDLMANLTYPAWMSLTGDVVPIEGRGRYFSSRNFIMGLSGIIITLLAGLIISRVGQPGGFQVALVVAFVLGMGSIYSFSHITDRPKPLAFPKVKEPLALAALLREMATHRDFLIFAAITALWNFSLNIAGPFFNVYLVEGLHSSAAMIALTAVASSLASMLGQRKMGDLNDRWGARRLAMITGLLIPIVPLLWVFARAGWHIIPINLLSGLLWGGYNLASFNYLLMITPENRRARYSALFQIIVTVSLALGAALGSLVVTNWGFNSVFIASAAGRLIAALLFVFLTARHVRRMNRTAESGLSQE